MLSRIRKRLKKSSDKFIKSRLPLQKTAVLNQSRIFIVPTRQGLMLLLVASLLILLAINFESSLNYGLAFWLVAMLWIAVHLTYRNMSGLKLEALAGNLVETGEYCEVQIQVSGVKDRDRGVIEFSHEQFGMVHVPLHKGKACLRIPLQAMKRGPVQPPRFRVESRYPFGFIVAWSNVLIDVTAWAYPKPIKVDRNLRHATGDEDQAQLDDNFVKSGSEDFHSLREYVPGDAVHRMHWPAFSRDQWLVKSFSDYQSSDEVIDWEQFPGLPIEQRLSAMCFEAETFNKKQIAYSVKFPTHEIPMGQGKEHLEKVHRALAEFGHDSD